MAHKEANEFFMSEIRGNKATLPIVYDIDGSIGSNGFFRVVIGYVPDNRHKLSEVRKHQVDKIGGITEQTISFAPTGGCPYCGR
jgi:hypothetical protein